MNSYRASPDFTTGLASVSHRAVTDGAVVKIQASTQAGVWKTRAMLRLEHFTRMCERGTLEDVLHNPARFL